MWNIIFFVAKSVLHLLIYLMSPMVYSNKNSSEESENFEHVENTFSHICFRDILLLCLKPLSLC